MSFDLGSQPPSSALPIREKQDCVTIVSPLHVIVTGEPELRAAHHAGSDDHAPERRTGTPVEVRCRFDGAWVRGFEVAAAVGEPDANFFRVRRRSDGAVLPALFPAEDVRAVS